MSRSRLSTGSHAAVKSAFRCARRHPTTIAQLALRGVPEASKRGSQLHAGQRSPASSAHDFDHHVRLFRCGRCFRSRTSQEKRHRGYIQDCGGDYADPDLWISPKSSIIQLCITPPSYADRRLPAIHWSWSKTDQAACTTTQMVAETVPYIRKPNGPSQSIGARAFYPSIPHNF